MERICVYPGSFDPPTLGHMDVIRRSCQLFDKVIVAVVGNPSKHGGFFPVNERVEMLRMCCAKYPQVIVDRFDGLTVQYAKACGATAIIRGLRDIGDFESQKIMAQINSTIAPEIETVFLVCLPEHSIVSSSGVRELASFGGNIKGFVPEEIEKNILSQFKKTP